MIRTLANGFLTLAVLSLSACFLFGDDDEDLQPNPLVKFQQSLDVAPLWSTKVGEGIEAPGIELSPVYYEGNIYVAGSGGTVSAVLAETGKITWSVKLDIPISGGPGVAEDLAVVGTLDGLVVALDATTGAQRWRSQVSSEVLAAPVTHRGVVVVRSQDGRIFGFNANDGSRLWVFDRSVPLLTLRGNSPPKALGGLIYVGFDNGRVVALRASDGVLAWEESIAVPQGRSDLERLVDIDGRFEILASDLYAVGFQGRIAALTAGSGRLLWVRDLSSHAGLVASRDRLFVSDADDAVWGLDRLSGGTLWRQEQLLRRNITAPASHGDSVVVGDFEGYLHWLSGDDGAFQARLRVDSNGLSGDPLALGPTLYVLGRSGRLVAYRLG